MKDLFKGCWTVPNLLSLLRILVIPVFAYFFIEGNAVLAILMLALSGISDFLDGKIARKFNQVSALGKVLDPVADKLTQITLAVLLFTSFNNAQDETLKAFSWVFLVFIIKELIMVVFGGIMLLLNLRPGAAEIYGKVATFAFYFIMILIVAFGPEVGMLREALFTLPQTLMIILVVVSAILTIVAFISYLPGTFKQFKTKFSKK
ncbi:MAG: CDP-alcohol phosphatidyltransferase family protein [Clostridia bacterium]|nr:CDP-alcohol phosphatidyltransferase family protein [Clostridia bacterium]